jgi:histidine triad (HIT) family protein/ATP adenylyltransferase
VLHHVQIACPPGGEESMRAFYHGVLGWAEIPKPPLLAARGGCWFAVPGVDGPAAELHIGPEDPFRPSELEQIIDEDDENIAFLCRYPTLTGHTLVAPKQHHEHVVRDLELEKFRRLTEMVHRVARAVETVVPTERMYLASLGSQQGNSHLHWHIAPLPPGVPYREQQFHALMAENGVLAWTLTDAVDLAGRLRGR